MSSLSIPSLSFLSIGCFSALYISYFRSFQNSNEIPLISINILIDLILTGSITLLVELLYKNNYKFFSYVISIIPIIIIFIICIIIIIIRFNLEKKSSLMKIIKNKNIITSTKKEKIKNIIKKL